MAKKDNALVNANSSFLDKMGDRIVGLINPKAEARRVHWRMYSRNDEYRSAFRALMSARGYRIADQSKKKTPWLGSNQTADSEINGDLPTMISRANELDRDDPIASGLASTFTMNVIGKGMRPQAQTGDEDKNNRMEKLFKKLKNKLSKADNMIYANAQQMKFRRSFIDGGVLVKMAKEAPDTPVWFETIEIDRVDTPSDVTFTDGGSIVKGVEKDRFGVPRAYWVLKSTPQNGFYGMKKAKDFDRVPSEVAVHLKFAERAGQTHGVTRLHAVAQDLRDLDLLILASLKRSQVAACLALFIKSDINIEELMAVTSEKEGYSMDNSLEPGMIMKLNPGESIESLIPNFPTPEFDGFIVMLARRIGAALGVSWQIVLKDFSKANYSSARTDLLEARQTYSAMQMWFIETLLNWEWKVVMEDALLRGEPLMKGVTAEDIESVLWIPNGWHWVDPVKEANAVKIGIDTGITTRQIECAKNGNDWKEVADQLIKEEAYIMEQRGLKGLPEVSPEEKTKRDQAFYSMVSVTCNEEEKNVLS